ncbi:hypothetical protein FS842_004636 [Serendipita sp. 407]|nr:hypothetical protein FS842_004636 [Serendipita sp. 407]
MISRLYPTIVMQHKLSRYRFRRARTTTGKEFFQSDHPNVVLGYSVADTGSLVGMAWATGTPQQVVNVGLDVMKFSIPRNTTVSDFFESQKHKLTDREQRDVLNGNSEEVLLRRILIILTIKGAYFKAIHQPPGFDYRRMECSLPHQLFKVDGHELSGWEIRMFKANLGIQRKETLVEEVYQCCAMIYRGPAIVQALNQQQQQQQQQLHVTGGMPVVQGKNRVYWNDKEGEATEMLNFLKVDQIVKAYDGLVLRNGPTTNVVNGRARTSVSQQGSGSQPGQPGQLQQTQAPLASSSSSQSQVQPMQGLQQSQSQPQLQPHGLGSSSSSIPMGNPLQTSHSMMITGGGGGGGSGHPHHAAAMVGMVPPQRRLVGSDMPVRRSSEDHRVQGVMH